MRMRIDDNGCLEIVDPDFTAVPLLRELDPGFTVRTAPLPEFTRPRFMSCRRTLVPLDPAMLKSLSETDLWRVHTEALKSRRPCQSTSTAARASLLDLKMELAQRLMKNCRLCARRCGVDRTSGTPGFCGLDGRALLAKWAPHIAEEAPVNPSLLVSVYGCALRCRYCQQGPLLDVPANPDARRLDEALWHELDTRGVRSLSFIGGNPDESLPDILRWLSQAPENWPLPIVWNCHAYSSPETLHLLEGIVDCYVPDFRYGNEACAIAWSQAPAYPAAASKNIQIMLNQHVPVIVRILALPGHMDCCHIPVLGELARMQAPNLNVSIRGQYCPDWEIDAEDGAMANRVSSGEIERLKVSAGQLGLRLIL